MKIPGVANIWLFVSLDSFLWLLSYILELSYTCHCVVVFKDYVLERQSYR